MRGFSSRGRLLPDTRNEHLNTRVLGLATVVASLSGLLFGFDTAVISGAIGFLSVHFGLSTAQEGWAVACLLIGCIAGSAASGRLGDRFGRRNMLIVTGAIFGASALGSALAGSFWSFVLFRMAGGLGVGIAATLAPLYIAEVAPPALRGRLMTVNQIATVGGILLVYFLNAWIAGQGDDDWGAAVGWRWMLGVAIVPSVLFMLLLTRVPASPRWLMDDGRPMDAFIVLARINGVDEARSTIADMGRAAQAHEPAGLRDLLQPGVRLALLVGVVMAILQQATGINAVMYYAPTIFRAAGMSVQQSLDMAIPIGFANLLFTGLSCLLIDRFGRKPLLLTGTALAGLMLGAIGWLFHRGDAAGWLLIAALFLYVAAIAISLGPITWVVITEIFPGRFRGRAMALAAMTLWSSDFLVSQAFPPALSTLGAAWVFWLFALVALAGVVFMARFLPETRGLTLEQVEHLWTSTPAQARLRPRPARIQPTGSRRSAPAAGTPPR
jgi:MFS transporter, SP family, arabinose:H+ symporter